MKKKMKICCTKKIIFVILLSITFFVFVLYYFSFKKSTFRHPVYGYSLNYPKNAMVVSKADGSLRLWESRTIEPVPSYSDVESPTKYMEISVYGKDKNKIEDIVMEGLDLGLLVSRDKFTYNNILFTQYCFETSVVFCRVYAENADKIVEFRLHDYDRWENHSLYQIILSTFRF